MQLLNKFEKWRKLTCKMKLKLTLDKVDNHNYGFVFPLNHKRYLWSVQLFSVSIKTRSKCQTDFSKLFTMHQTNSHSRELNTGSALIEFMTGFALIVNHT